MLLRRLFSYYQVLGLQKDCTPQQIKARYYELAKLHHPDASGNEVRFKAVNEAYETLSNPVSRKAYDEKLAFEAQSEQRHNQQHARQAGQEYHRKDYSRGETHDWATER